MPFDVVAAHHARGVWIPGCRLRGTAVNEHRTIRRLLLLLAALEGGAAFFVLVRIPREAAGYSPARLALLAVLGILAALWAYLAFRPSLSINASLLPKLIVGSATLSLISAISLFLLRYLDPETMAPIYERLSVMLWYVLALGMEFSIFLLILRFGLHFAVLGRAKALILPAGLGFGGLMAVAGLVATTRLGLTPDPAYWGEPGVPVMGWQLGLTLLVGLGILLVGLRMQRAVRWDLWIPAGLWLAASVIWLSVPIEVMRNSFYAPMSPPTYQAYPNSDAGYYDSMAESLLIGYPYQGEIPARPLYIAVLTALHLVVGEHYDLIILGQTLVLAFIPVVLYLLGRRLHSRAAGVMAAFLAICREWTGLLVSSQTRVSNTKTLLVDLPTLLLVLVSCLMVVRWLQRRDSRSALIAGGTFGILLLLRTQALMVLPFMLLLAILAYGVRSPKWVAPVALFVAAFGVTILPWMLHNYLSSGHIAFDAPFQYDIIASQYRYTGNLDIANVDLQGKSLPEVVLAFAIRDPKFVLDFITTHFLATQIDGLLALPLLQPYNGLLAPINLYWLTWNGTLAWYNLLLLLSYLVFIAVGLGVTWSRLRWIGLTPLAFSLGYSLANGLGRFSGWRYDLPADWISYFYLCIGMAAFIEFPAQLFGAKTQVLSEAGAGHGLRGPDSLMGIVPLLGFVLLGAVPWIAQGIAGPRYAAESAPSLIGALAASPAVERLGGSARQVQAFAASPRAAVEVGRILYPRFFPRDSGLASAHPWPAYAPRDFPRLGFLLLNQTRHDVIFPTRQSPEEFPHGADAVILGCLGADYIDARLVLFPASGSAFLSGTLDSPCP
jgi:hypothetical protein